MLLVEGPHTVFYLRKPFKHRLTSYHRASFWFWRNGSSLRFVWPFFETVKKASHRLLQELSMKSVICLWLYGLRQSGANKQPALWCFSTPTALMFVWETFHLSRSRSTVPFFNRDSQRQLVSHVDLLPPTVLF